MHVRMHVCVAGADLGGGGGGGGGQEGLAPPPPFPMNNDVRHIAKIAALYSGADPGI